MANWHRAGLCLVIWGSALLVGIYTHYGFDKIAAIHISSVIVGVGIGLQFW